MYYRLVSKLNDPASASSAGIIGMCHNALHLINFLYEFIFDIWIRNLFSCVLCQQHLKINFHTNTIFTIGTSTE